MKITINTIRILNFKGLKNKEISLNPALTTILGENHIGKTTIVDAVQWCLFGKNSKGESDFGITPTREDTTPIYHLENKVEIELVKDGQTVTLVKSRTEKWTKPRGQEEEVMSGHTVNYFVDGDKYTEKDYKLYISSIISEGLFKTVTNPFYFPTLKPDDQRALLIKMVGESDPEKIAEGNDNFKQIIKKMQKEDLITYRQHLSYRIREIKDELGKIPPRIEENMNTVANYKGVDYNDLRNKIKVVTEEISKIDAVLSDKSKVVDVIFEKKSSLRTRIANKKSDIEELKCVYDTKNRQKIDAWQKQVDDLNNKKSISENRIKYYDDQIINTKEDFNRLSIKVKDFNDRWDKVDGRQWKWDESKEICPTCKQHLPEADIETMKGELEDNFNLAKTKELDAMDDEAKLLKREKESIEASGKDYEDHKKEEEKNIEGYESSLKLLSGKPKEDDYKETEAYQMATKEIYKLTGELESIKEPDKEDSVKDDSENDAKGRKSKLSEERDSLQDSLSSEKFVKLANDRIKELKDEQVKLNKQLTELEKEDYQAEQFNLALISDLEKRVNGLFTNVRFKMFKTLINGNIQPTCECTLHGTLYGDLSSSERINSGIDIINAVCKYNNVYAPCFIDNAESINDVMPMKSQQILLVVSRDKELTIIK